MQTPLQSFDDLSLHGASSTGAGASSGSSDYDLAEAERLRKQRELKRKSRERKKVTRLCPDASSWPNRSTMKD